MEPEENRRVHGPPRGHYRCLRPQRVEVQADLYRGMAGTVGSAQSTGDEIAPCLALYNTPSAFCKEIDEI